MSIEKQKYDEHCLSPKLFEELLKNKFTNEYYNIKFSKQSPNNLKATFINKVTEDKYLTNIGLSKKDGKIVVKAEPHLDFQILRATEYSTFNPELLSTPEEFINLLNNELISVTNSK